MWVEPGQIYLPAPPIPCRCVPVFARGGQHCDEPQRGQQAALTISTDLVMDSNHPDLAFEMKLKRFDVALASCRTLGNLVFLQLRLRPGRRIFPRGFEGVVIFLDLRGEV